MDEMQLLPRDGTGSSSTRTVGLQMGEREVGERREGGTKSLVERGDDQETWLLGGAKGKKGRGGGKGCVISVNPERPQCTK